MSNLWRGGSPGEGDQYTNLRSLISGLPLLLDRFFFLFYSLCPKKKVISVRKFFFVLNKTSKSKG